jgi:hypothetical protein
MATEKSEKTEASPRSEAMAKVWAGRRAWSLAPTCCCGCDQRLEIAGDQARQTLFKPGHDAALRSLLRKVLSGSVPRERIPEAARANLARIKFIQANPELKRAFANPGQKALRQRATPEATQ